MLHMTKFEARFEFLAGKIGLCDSKHALSCQTCEKSPKMVNIYSKIPKFSCQTRLIAKLNSWKEIWISRLEAPPTPYVGNCRCTPLVQALPISPVVHHSKNPEMAKRPLERGSCEEHKVNPQSTPFLQKYPRCIQRRRIVPPRPGAETARKLETFLTKFSLSFVILCRKYRFLCAVVTYLLSMYIFQGSRLWEVWILPISISCPPLPGQIRNFLNSFHMRNMLKQ